MRITWDPKKAEINWKGNDMEKEYDFAKAKRGQVVPTKGKTRVTMYIDTDILNDFRERADKAGYGYQTMINEALREYLAKSGKPLDETAIRQVIREELARAVNHWSSGFPMFSFTNSENVALFPVDPAIAAQAIALRALHQLKTQDAIQLGTALAWGTDYIVTNDARWCTIANLPFCRPPAFPIPQAKR